MLMELNSKVFCTSCIRFDFARNGYIKCYSVPSINASYLISEKLLISSEHNPRKPVSYAVIFHKSAGCPTLLWLSVDNLIW